MKTTITLMLLLVAATIMAQEPFRGCGFDHLLYSSEHQVRWNEAYRHALEHHHNQQRADGVLAIPVVFHVVWHEDYQNLHDSVIQSQIDVLNEDYRRLNADAINTRSEFLSVAADTEIEFFLAEVDPNGEPTSGIVHVETDVTGFELNLLDFSTLDAVKLTSEGGSDAWDPDHYLNIWVCNMPETFWGQIFGYAYPPEGAPNWPAGNSAPEPGLEGVVLHYATVGRNNPQGMDDNLEGNEKGRTCTHEVGHYLGLRHIWGDAFFNGCTEDDGLEDTPNASTSTNFVCDYSKNGCDDGESDLPDMIENYMDYNEDECYNMFTYEQREMMRFCLETFRPGLLEGVGIAVPEVQEVSFSLFPNPAGESFSVTGQWPAFSRLMIHDMSGRVVQEQAIKANGTQQIDITNLAAGSYVVSINESAPQHLMKR
ncbi:MAG: T9SS type A sorting domain-containing protein [Flavobacteriales bacterium]|nr:T9SS type A sorting domain-containing protein [Flavobacteriales bacterium]